jgi:hypothetical protein
MDLPVIAIVFIGFTFLLSLYGIFIRHIQVLGRYILLSYICAYIILSLTIYPDSMNVASPYMLSALITHSAMLSGSLWLSGHLTSLGKRRIKTARAC